MSPVSWFGPETVTAVVLLVIAFVLSALIGLERERQLKSAGLRTHTLVGLGAALFTLVGAYGFDGIANGAATTDPARIAAQVVTGIGFLGAGVIFVRKTVVSGLTTAASIWVTAAVGVAVGAGMPVVAIVATVLYFVAVVALSPLSRWAVARRGRSVQIVSVRYLERGDVMRAVLECLGNAGCEAAIVASRDAGHPDGDRADVTIRIEHPRMIPDDVITRLRALDGVASVLLVSEHEE